MWDRVKTFLFEREGRAEAADGHHSMDELHIAAATLLAEAALLDGTFDEAEGAQIAAIAVRHFGLDHEAAENLVVEAKKRAETAVEISALIRVLMKHFDYDERVRMIEMLWEVVYADGELHAFEANLLRRLAGLLHVSDRDSGTARKRVLAHMKSHQG